nr:tail fiber domain-containing protein [Escherichia coli]
MRQHIIQSSSSGWEWTAWKKFQSLDFTDSPQFTNLNLVRSSDVATTAGGILQSILNDASGAQRARTRFYTEFRGDGKAWATTHLQCDDTNVYAGLNHDGDFALSQGSFIGKTAKLLSNVSNPFTLQSAHPAIKFDETDRPEGSPDYAFIFDGGDWRIEKNHWETPAGGNCIGYNYARNEIEVPNLKVTAIVTPSNLEQTKTNMQIPFAGIAHWVDYNAPTGAEAGKYYPVIVSHPSYYNGDFLVEIAMRTKSISGSEEPNCNAIHLWLRDGGWSDMGAAVFGHYFCYANNENSILCVRGTDRGQYPHNAIYVRGDAFPIRLAVTVGCTVTIPTADWKPANTEDSPTYKWGITNSSDGIDLDTYGISNNLLDFTSSATGFYCTDTYRNKYGDSYQVIQSNGTILPPNGLGVSESSDWNAQITDTVAKFKPIEGVTNSPENGTNYCGFHAQFAGRYATQFAGRNSKFYARSFEAGVDKGWCQIATLNASSQRWTGYQQFKSTEFFADTFTRKVSVAVANSAARNGELYLWGAASRPTVFEYKIKDPDTNASLSWVFYAQQNTDDSCQLQVNGAVNCVTVNQSSDRDLKDNIQIIGDATEAIRKMNGYTYTLKENGLPYAGVIAQEVMEALPEAVGSFTHYGKALQGPTTDGNELREETRYLNVDYAAVTGLLVQVARETDNRVTELEEENASLRANIAVMDERIAKLEALVRQLTGSEK